MAPKKSRGSSASERPARRRVQRNGRWINPATLVNDPVRPLAADVLPAFLRHRDALRREHRGSDRSIVSAGPQVRRGLDGVGAIHNWPGGWGRLLERAGALVEDRVGLGAGKAVLEQEREGLAPGCFRIAAGGLNVGQR